MTAKRKNLWFGFLEAGEKGSPVIRDRSLNTGQSSTIYLFNLRKGRIIEYRRDVVEPKLRELTLEEQDAVADMEATYDTVRADFIPRAEQRSEPRPRKRPKNPDLDLLDVDLDEVMPFFDLGDEGSEADADI